MESEKYDIIIDINSIRFLQNKGWKIIYTNTEKENDLKDLLNSSKKSIVSILGHSNRGKTYILQRISGVKLEAGYQIQTKGLSIKIPEKKNILLLDTAGTNAPLLVEEGEEDRRHEKNFQKDLDEINLCQIITNYIIQTFIIKVADTLICIVGMLTAAEQQFLNKVKKNCRNKKKLIVIHNLIKCYTKRDIEKYKNEILLKSIINEFEERPIPSLKKDKKDDGFNKFYIEKDEGHEYDVRHFIFGNDDSNDKSSSNEIKYYNDSTIKYIQDYIDVTVVKESNIIKKLREHIKDLSSSVLINELNSITSDIDNLDLIKCVEKIEPKDIIADELDNVTFIGKDYEPSTEYYRKKDKFIIKIHVCSKLNENTLKVKNKTDKDNKDYTKFIISGERLICGEKKSQGINVIHNFINKREALKKFKVTLMVKFTDFGFRTISPEYSIKINYGILYIIYDIINY